MLHTQLVSPVLVDRRPELEALEALLDGACAGRGAAALIAGDAGIGKTRLCRALKAAAAARQVRVIEGRSSAAESSVPYGPFMDALRFRLAKGEGEQAAHVLDPVLGHLAPFFAELASSGGARAREATASATPFDTIFRVLQRLGSLGPALFILEDVHWADATSRDLLHYIARRITGIPMVLVATYRADETHAGHPLTRVVAGLARERAALHIELEPLTPADLHQMLEAMLGAPPSAGFVDAVFARTEGNPLFVEELTSVLMDAHPERAPGFVAADLEDVAVPATLHEVVRERLGPLSADAREALTVAAVIGRRFRFDVLAESLDWPDERLLTALEELVAWRVIMETADERDETYSFRRSLVQEVLYTSTIARRRRMWHRRVAAALERVRSADGLPHTVLAHHYSLGGELERARTHRVLAGDEAVRLSAWQDAEAMYEQALALLEVEGGDPGAEADILERMVDVCWWQNRIVELEQYAAEALAIRRRLGQRRQAAWLLRRLANLHGHQRGETERALRSLGEALELLEDDDAERVVVLNDMGRLHLMRGEFDAAATLFERSLQLSAGRGDCTEEAVSLVLLGRVAVQSGELTKGVARLQLARALLDEQAVSLERSAEVFHAGIRALESARQYRLAWDWVDAALEYARVHGARGDRAVYEAYRAAVQRRAGQWEAGLDAATQAVAELRRSGRAEVREALRILGDLRRVRGDLADARAAYEEAQHLGETDAAIGVALVFMAEGNHADAAVRLQSALVAHATDDRLFALRVLPILVEAHAEADAEAARRALQELRALVALCDYPPGATVVAQASGIVHAAMGERAAAIRELRTAVEGWRALELPYERARAQLLLARQLVAGARTRDEGILLATEAAHQLEQLGAANDASRAHALLRTVGVRRRRSRRAAAAAVPAPLNRLSPRELEVLTDMARGRTNKQIARALALSPRTVGNHVGSILAKLGCATRTEASRLALDALSAGVSE